jgi:RNA polymerase sigma factor (sigma-70 family)
MDVTLRLEFEERDFIQACIARERWAQQKLYKEYYSKMMSVCLRYANNEDDALDIMHEGFIKVFRHIGMYQPGTSMIAWMRRIMVNTAIDYYRKNIRRRTEDIETAYDLSTGEADAVSKCSEKDILNAIQQLTPAYRTVFNLYVIEGFSHKEISEQLDITESTSRSNLVKARVKLQAILTGKNAIDKDYE